MRTLHLTPMRGALVVLLVGSALLFLIGSTIERNHSNHEATPAAHAKGSGEEGGDETVTEGAKSGETHVEKANGEAGAKILGVNTETLALSIVAVVASFLLAAAVWLRIWPRWVLLAVVAFGLVFAAGDAREVVHQLDESNNGLAAVASILIALHLAIALIAALLLRPPSPARAAVSNTV
jgi:hypothetical protein